MMRIVIGGAGLAGSILARVAELRGHEVTIIDRGEANTASRASSNLWTANWLVKFPEGRRATEAVEELYGNVSRSKVFQSGIADAMKVRHIAPEQILRRPTHRGQVEDIAYDGPEVLANFTDKPVSNHTWTVRGDAYVDCTGFRSGFLRKQNILSGRTGHCFRFAASLVESKLWLPAPYTHAKLFEEAPGQTYFGDSVAVDAIRYPERMNELRARSLARLRSNAGKNKELLSVLDAGHYSVTCGIRPVCSSHPFGLATKVGERVYCLNGGGKNGIAAYCLRAKELVSMMEADRVK